HRSDFDMIIDEIESQASQTSQAPKKGRKLTTSSHGSYSTTSVYNLNKSVTSNSDLSPASNETTQLSKCKKRLSDLALDCLDLNVSNDVNEPDESDDIEPDDEAVLRL
ncbi:11862_t:CDS:2, partial [Racocetra fulgida]